MKFSLPLSMLCLGSVIQSGVALRLPPRSKLLEFHRSLLQKRRVRFVEIRMLHA